MRVNTIWLKSIIVAKSGLLLCKLYLNFWIPCKPTLGYTTIDKLVLWFIVLFVLPLNTIKSSKYNNVIWYKEKYQKCWSQESQVFRYHGNSFLIYMTCLNYWSCIYSKPISKFYGTFKLNFEAYSYWSDWMWIAC